MSDFRNYNKSIDECTSLVIGPVFKPWNLVKYHTIGDGNCLFHAICNSYFTGYHSEKIDKNHVSRTKMVQVLRQELASKLPEYYDKLSNGNMATFSKDVPEYTLANMQKTLNSKAYIGYGYLEYIGLVLNKDIYIIDGAKGDLYKSDDIKLYIKGNRPSIVLYYIMNHYELVGLIVDKSSCITHFLPDHPFIKFLHERIK